MLRLLVLFLFTFACSCQAGEPRDPSGSRDPERMASVVLFSPEYNASICGAVRLRNGRLVTAKHCIKEAEKTGDYVAEAIDADGYSSSVYLESLVEDRDVAYLTGKKSEYGVVEGIYANGDAELITNQPYRLLRRRAQLSALEEPFVVFDKQGGAHLLTHLAIAKRPCISGESGSGVFQHGRVVGVVTAGNWQQCLVTVLK
jgi:hypothetical protein